MIKAWSKSGDIFAGKRAEQLVKRMQVLAAEEGNDHLLPNDFTYGDVSRAWATSGHADAVEKAKKYAAISRELHETSQQDETDPSDE